MRPPAGLRHRSNKQPQSANVGIQNQIFYGLELPRGPATSQNRSWYDDGSIFAAAGGFDDSGTFSLTITLSGADQVASTDSGTIPVTVTLSGADQVASTDSGTIPVTVSLSGADRVASTDAGTIPLTITITGTEVFGAAPIGHPRINEFAYNKDLSPVS